MKSVKKKILSIILLMGNVLGGNLSSSNGKAMPTRSTGVLDVSLQEPTVSLSSFNEAIANTLDLEDEDVESASIHVPSLRAVSKLLLAAWFGGALSYMLKDPVSVSSDGEKTIDLSNLKSLDRSVYKKQMTWGDLISKYNNANVGLIPNDMRSERALGVLLAKHQQHVDGGRMSMPWAPAGLFGSIYVRDRDTIDENCPDALPRNDLSLTDRGPEIRKYLCELIKTVYKNTIASSGGTYSLFDFLRDIAGDLGNDGSDSKHIDVLTNELLKCAPHFLALSSIFYGLPNSFYESIMPLGLRVPTVYTNNGQLILTTSDSKKGFFGGRVGTFELNLNDIKKKPVGIGTTLTSFGISVVEAMPKSMIYGYIRKLYGPLLKSLNEVLGSVISILRSDELKRALETLKASTRNLSDILPNSLCKIAKDNLDKMKLPGKEATVTSVVNDISSVDGVVEMILQGKNIPKEFCDLISFFVRESLKILPELGETIGTLHNELKNMLGKDL